MTEEAQTQDVKLPEPADHRYKFRDMLGREVWESGVPYGCTVIETQALFTADQVRAAVMAERERCARVAENTHPNDWAFIAAAIRSGS